MAKIPMKNLSPEGLSLISLQRGGAYSVSEWNNGMVEEWNIGNQKRMTLRFLKLNRAILKKIDPNPLNPAFQLFSIPSFHSHLKQDSRQSRLSLTDTRFSETK
jgi:hypothetical protein